YISNPPLFFHPTIHFCKTNAPHNKKASPLPATPFLVCCCLLVRKGEVISEIVLLVLLQHAAEEVVTRHRKGKRPHGQKPAARPCQPGRRREPETRQGQPHVHAHRAAPQRSVPEAEGVGAVVEPFAIRGENMPRLEA